MLNHAVTRDRCPSEHQRAHSQNPELGLEKEHDLGCVNPAHRLLLAMKSEFKQTRARFFFYTALYTALPFFIFYREFSIDSVIYFSAGRFREGK